MKPIVALLALLPACAPFVDPGPACTDLFAFGLTVTVTNPTGGRVCDATVTAVDGDHQETLEPQGSGQADCVYVGAGERAGTYDITAHKEGFSDATTSGVVVDEDECHVIGQAVSLQLGTT